MSEPNISIKDRKLRSLLSLAQKAGKLSSGEQGAEIALRSGTAELVITACDASDNTKKKFSQKTFYYKKEYREVLTKEGLSAAIGKANRSVIAVCDKGFAKSMLGILTAVHEVQNSEVLDDG